MDDNIYRIIIPPLMTVIETTDGDEIATRPDATVIDGGDWEAMILTAGSEQALLDEMEITVIRDGTA